MIRKATQSDIDSIESIYNSILDLETKGLSTIGWLPGVYPVRSTAEAALSRDDLYVLEDNNTIVASAIFNKIQVDVYSDGKWLFDADDDHVFVVHTLVVDPCCSHKGYGQKMIQFYEELGRQTGAKVLRLDTNMKNKRALEFYRKLGYRFCGYVPCTFNNIPNVNLALLEKKI